MSPWRSPSSSALSTLKMGTPPMWTWTRETESAKSHDDGAVILLQTLNLKWRQKYRTWLDSVKCAAPCSVTRSDGEGEDTPCRFYLSAGYCSDRLIPYHCFCLNWRLGVNITVMSSWPLAASPGQLFHGRGRRPAAQRRGQQAQAGQRRRQHDFDGFNNNNNDNHISSLHCYKSNTYNSRYHYDWEWSLNNDHHNWKWGKWEDSILDYFGSACVNGSFQHGVNIMNNTYSKDISGLGCRRMFCSRGKCGAVRNIFGRTPVNSPEISLDYWKYSFFFI